MIIDIFIRTYERDFFLLKYAIISISKFLKGYRYIHICSREKDYDSLLNLLACKELNNIKNIITHKSHDFPDNIDYCGQQIIKMSADYFSDAEYICFTDSDTIYYDEINLEKEFINENNTVNFYFDVWENVGNANCWQTCLSKLNLLTKYEFMRRLPVVCPAKILKEVRNYLEKMHNKTFVEECLSMFNDCGISEFNIMSSYMYLFYNGEAKFININETHKLPILQLWSHSNKQELIYKIHKALNI